MFITIALLFSCIITPVQVALYDELSFTWTSINYTIDGLFLIDIVVIFNSAVYNEDFEVVKDRRLIFTNYIWGWFLIDLVAIIPFDLIFGGGTATNLLRYARIGRITKMLKMIKLLRLMKLQKQSTFSIVSWIQDALSISADFKWFLMFFAYFAMTTHVVSCFWIIAGQMSESDEAWTTQYDA